MKLGILVGLATTAAAAAAAIVAQVPAAQAATHLPYTDPNQAGWLTLCGTNLKPVTAGSVTAKPFVWRVVSDVPAPTGYFVKGAKATMFAYQPRRGTPAGAWSGTVMAAASYYYTRAHPGAQFTPIDSPLTQMTTAYPPLWDHLIELRLYLGAPDIPTLMMHYAAADIQVIGSTWRLVAGGHSSCTAGKVVAEETSVGMPGARAKPTATPSASPSDRPTSTSARSSADPSGSRTSPGSPGSSPNPGSSGATTPAGAAPGKAPPALSGSSTAGVVTGLALGAAVIAMAIIGRALWRRQRRATG